MTKQEIREKVLKIDTRKLMGLEQIQHTEMYVNGVEEEFANSIPTPLWRIGSKLHSILGYLEIVVEFDPKNVAAQHAYKEALELSKSLVEANKKYDELIEKIKGKKSERRAHAA